jgi:undecaprenyl-diphosphatase
MIEFFQAVLFGIVEGITEWLPVSSTGHIILLDAIWPLKVSADFYDLFEIVIQLGAILAVIVLFFHKLNPFSPKKTAEQRKDTWSLWIKVIIAVIPSAVLGILLDEPLDEWLRDTAVLDTDLNTIVVAAALILYGIAFILVEKRNGGRAFRITETGQLDYKTALLIGAFQCLSIIPGTSRSGATILGAILLGVSRNAGAEFSFFMAIPTMLGASGLKLLVFLLKGIQATSMEVMILIVGCVISFVVSLLVIKGLMEYVRKHSFSLFGVYRIVLGIVVLLWFLL